MRVRVDAGQPDALTAGTAGDVGVINADVDRAVAIGGDQTSTLRGALIDVGDIAMGGIGILDRQHEHQHQHVDVREKLTVKKVNLLKKSMPFP